MKKMNNKGFTLMELLATIVVLGLVTTFTIVTIVNLFDEGKNKAEEAFAKQIEGYIEDYIAMYNKNINFTSVQTAYKCHPDESNPDRKMCDDVTVQKSTGNNFEDIIYIVVGKDLINPKTKQPCTNDGGSNLTIYRDEDFVYCFKLEGVSCLSYTINTCNGLYKTASGANDEAFQ